MKAQAQSPRVSLRLNLRTLCPWWLSGSWMSDSQRFRQRMPCVAQASQLAIRKRASMPLLPRSCFSMFLTRRQRPGSLQVNFREVLSHDG